MAHIYQLNAEGRGKPCQAQGCNGARKGAGRFCPRHQVRLTRYGSPLGTPLKPSSFNYERDTVRAFLASRTKHEAAVASVDAMERFLSLCAAGRVGVMGWPESYQAVRVEAWRLRNAGVTGLDLLIECSALILFVRRNPRAIPDDERLTRALAHSLLKLAKREQRWTAKGGKRHRPQGSRVLQTIGRELRGDLVSVFLNVARGVEKVEDAERRRQHALKVSFDLEPLEAERLLDEITGTTKE